MAKKNFSNLISNSGGGFPAPGAQKTLSKNAKICCLNVETIPLAHETKQ